MTYALPVAVPQTAGSRKEAAFDYPFVVGAHGVSSRGNCHAKRSLAHRRSGRMLARLAVALAQRLGDYEQVRDAIHSRAAT
jgi:hypothetical protein